MPRALWLELSEIMSARCLVLPGNRTLSLPGGGSQRFPGKGLLHGVGLIIKCLLYTSTVLQWRQTFLHPLVPSRTSCISPHLILTFFTQSWPYHLCCTDEDTETQKVKPVTSPRSHNEDIAEVMFGLPKPHASHCRAVLTGLLSSGGTCIRMLALPHPYWVTSAELPAQDVAASCRTGMIAEPALWSSCVDLRRCVLSVWRTMNVPQWLLLLSLL